MKEKIYDSLISRGLLHKEQRETNETRETGYLLYIDQHILKESKTRRKI